MRADKRVVKAGGHLVNVDAVAAAHWEGEGARRKLFVYYLGGRFEQFPEPVASLIWREVQAGAIDLETGEVIGGK